MKKSAMTIMVLITAMASICLLTGPSYAGLKFVDAHYDTTCLDTVCSVTVSPDGKHLYTTARYDDDVAVFSRDIDSGMLSFVEAEGVDTPYSVAVSPDGYHVYVGASSGMQVFSRNSSTGELNFVEGGDWGGISSVKISPDGNHVYITGYILYVCATRCRVVG